MVIYPYKVISSGFYQRGETTPLFGDLKDFLPGFIEWVHSRNSIIETKTFEDQEQTVISVYCLDAFLIKNTSSYGVVLWNELPQHEDGMLSVPLSSNIGDVEVETSEITEDNIPGWPTYLYIVPENELITIIVPRNMGGFIGSGIPQVRRYFTEYLKLRSEYVVREKVHESQDEYTHRIYRLKDNKGTEWKNLNVRFHTKELRTKGNFDKITSQSNQIYKLVTRSSLNKDFKDDKNFIDKIFDHLFKIEAEHESNTVNYKSEIDWDGNDNINNIIDFWENKINNNKTEFDIGVRFRGESGKIYWFSNARGRFDYKLPRKLNRMRLWGKQEMEEIWDLVQNRVFEIDRNSII